MASLTIPRRFNGPPHSGNGGWSAGALAETLPGSSIAAPVTVALRLPPPLDTPLPITETPTGAVAHHEGRPVLEAHLAEHAPRALDPVPVKDAAEAEARYAGFRRHPFPTCFTCGPARRPGDGLRIFPGRVADGRGDHPDAPVAATWTPYQVTVPILWAALDCVGGWSTDVGERPMVLGTITVHIRRLPLTAERYVAVGAAVGTAGRKTFTASTLFDPSGSVVATAEHVWLTIDPKAFS